MKRGEWPTLDFVVTNALDGVAHHIDALAARLAAAERERDKALVKADTLQFLVNQRAIDIDSLRRERDALREAAGRVSLKTGRYEECDCGRDALLAALERQR